MFLSRSVISSTLVAILGVALVAAKPPASWSPGQSAVSPINLSLVAIPIPSGVPNTFSSDQPVETTLNALVLASSGLPHLERGQAYDLALRYVSHSPAHLNVWFFPINSYTGQPTAWSIHRTVILHRSPWGVVTLTAENAMEDPLNPRHPGGAPTRFSITIAYAIGAHPAPWTNRWYGSYRPIKAFSENRGETFDPVAIPSSDPLTFADQHQPAGGTATAKPLRVHGLPILPTGQAYDLALGFSYSASNQPNVMRVWLYPVHIDTGSPTGWAALRSMPVHPGQSGTTSISQAYLDPGNYWGSNPLPPKSTFTVTLHYHLGADPQNGFNSWYIAKP